MRRAIGYALVLLVTAVAPSAAQNRAALEADLDQLRLRLGIAHLSAAVVESGTIVWVRHFGIKAAPGGAVSYPIGSLTMPLTAALVLSAVQQGRLQLDGPTPPAADKAKPSARGVSADVSLRHLLSHTAAGTPGTRFLYSPELFGLTGHALQSVFGAPFHQALSAHLLKPVGLRNTVATASTTPASGVTSTVEDLARFAIALERGTLITRQTASEMFQPPRFGGRGASPYALGWFVQQVSGEPIRWHFGEHSDGSGLLMTLPARRLTFVVLARSNRLSSPFGLHLGDIRWSPAAVAFLTSWARVKLDLPEARRIMIDALAKLGTGDRSSGASLAKKAIGLAPGLVTVPDGAVLAALARSGDAELRSLARSVAKRLLAPDAEHPRVLVDLAVVHLDEGQPSEAAALLRKVIDGGQATPEINRLATTLLGGGRPE